MSEAWAGLGRAPREVIRIWGMRRSGNHAIINWLMRNAPVGGVLFLNNCKPKGHPLQTHRAVELNAERINPTRYGGLACVAEALGEGFTLMYSYEDRVPRFGQDAPQLEAGVPDSAVDREIIIYRSFLNWAASLLRKIQHNAAYDAEARERIMTRAVRRYFRMLDALERVDCAIHYDAWIASEDYRAAQLEALGWPLADNTLGVQQRFGGGSSFRDSAPDAAALAERWAQMCGEPEFAGLVQAVRENKRQWKRLIRAFPEDAARIEEMGDLR